LTSVINKQNGKLIEYKGELNETKKNEFTLPDRLNLKKIHFELDLNQTNKVTKLMDVNGKEYMTGEICKSVFGMDDDDCFLTTACVNHMNKHDDCFELTELRKFRDGYLKKSESGLALIKDYYAIAPSIVANINAHDDRNAIYDGIYNEMIIKTIDEIQQKNFNKAIEIYQGYTLHLKKQFG
jgi:hypothetical protein